MNTAQHLPILGNLLLLCASSAHRSKLIRIFEISTEINTPVLYDLPQIMIFFPDGFFKIIFIHFIITIIIGGNGVISAIFFMNGISTKVEYGCFFPPKNPETFLRHRTFRLVVFRTSMEANLSAEYKVLYRRNKHI